jgi:ParB family chromosome partitioning protein
MVVLLKSSQFEAMPPDVLELSDDTRIPLALIDSAAHNPRANLPDISALASNIAALGLLQPIAVRRVGNRYELIGGHRRVAAFRLLHARDPQDPRWCSIAAIVRKTTDEMAYLAAISMAVHSRAWSPQEEAAALERLAESRTLREVGALVNRTESWVSKRLKIYSDSVVSGFVQSRRLSTSVAQELLLVRDTDQRSSLAERAVTEHWSPEHARSEVQRLNLGKQLRSIARQTAALSDVLAWAQPDQLSEEARRSLIQLRDRIEEMLRPAAAQTGADARSAA